MVRKLLDLNSNQFSNSGLLFSVFFACLLFFSESIYSQTTITETNPGTYTFTIPAGVTSIQVQSWGAGGAGGNVSGTTNNAGGGGGGAFAQATIPVVGGQTYTYVVGVGGTPGNPASNGGDSFIYNDNDPSTNLVDAGGGQSVGQNDSNGASGGVVNAGTGYVGGDGADGYSSGGGFLGPRYNGGGGGSSAGTSSDGTNATNRNGANAPTGGGDGGNGTRRFFIYLAPESGQLPGGGGGGAAGTYATGGSGGNGQVIITYTCSIFSLTNTAVTSPVSENNPATVTLAGNLPVGTYDVTYDLTYPDASSATFNATMNVTSAGTGTFTTTNLVNPGFNDITITDLVSVSCASVITANNTATIEVCPTYSLTSTSVISPITYEETTDVTLNGNLPIGTYTVSYDLTGDNAFPGNTASMTVTTAGTGTFTTGILNAAGSTTVVVTNIASGNCSNAISANNSAVITINEPELSIFGDGNSISHTTNFFSSIFDFDNLTDFGWVGIGETIIHTYTISNIKSGTLDISDLLVNFELGDISQFGLDKTNVDANNPLPGVSSATFTLSFTPTTYGRNAVQVSLSSNDPTYNPFTFWVQGNGTKAAAPYCTPKKLQGNDSNKVHYISNVDIRTIDNSTVGITSKYSNFTDPLDLDIPGFDPIEVGLGETVTGSVSVTVNGDNTNTNELVIWLDFDQSDTFEDNATEKYIFPVTDGTDTGTATKQIDVPVSFNIPAGAALGTTRMRIAFHDNANSYDACDFNKNKGEVEDYSINIASCGLNTWTGAINTDWQNIGNWSCSSVPIDSSNGNVLIPSGLGNYPIISSGIGNEGYAYTLEIEPGATLTVIDNYLDIESNLQIDGSLILQDEGQLLQQSGSTFDDDSLGYLQRSQQGTADLYTYNYWSSPVYIDNSIKVGYGPSRVNNFTLGAVLPGITFISGYNGMSPSSIAQYWIFKFNDRTAGDYSEWQQTGSTGDIIAGEGYTMKGPGTGGVGAEYTYDFQGKPNNGDITLGLTPGNGYLLGNPYPSALDADQFIVDNVNPNPIFDGTIYFWEHWGGGSHNISDYQGGYATYNLSGGIGTGSGTTATGGSKTPLRYIPVGQGFFVTADDGGTITFNNGQRAFVMEGGSSIFFKSEKQNRTAASDTRRKLRIGIEMEKEFKKEILLTEDTRATEGFDYGFDGKLIDGYSHDIFWNLEDENYSIQGVPEFDKNSVFEFGIQMESSGNIKIKVNDFENNEEFNEVYLIDRTSKTSYEILNNTVSLDLEEGDYKNRFAVAFLPAERSLTDDFNLEDGIFAYMNNDFDELQITRFVDASIKEIALFNLLGQKVQVTSEGLTERYFTIPVSQRTGVYILHITTDKGVTGKQILIE